MKETDLFLKLQNAKMRKKWQMKTSSTPARKFFNLAVYVKLVTEV